MEEKIAATKVLLFDVIEEQGKLQARYEQLQEAKVALLKQLDEQRKEKEQKPTE